MRQITIKYIIALCVLFFLQGCLTPLYKNYQDTALLADISIEAYNTRDGQILNNALAQQFYLVKPAQKARYKLQRTLQTNVGYLGLLKDETNAIGEVNTTVNFMLYDVTINEMILNFSISRKSSFTQDTLSAFTIDVALSNATRQTIDTIAISAKNRILSFLQSYETSSQ